MTDPIATAAYATAERLTAEYGSGLVADVATAVHVRETAKRPSQYLDPVSLGSLIVTIATLAWTIYSDHRKKTADPPPGVVARQVRTELRQHSDIGQQETDGIIQIVVTEVIHAARDQR